MAVTDLRRQKANSFFLSEGTFATSLMALCVDEYTTEFLSWDPDTLVLSLQETYGEVPQVNLDKIFGMISVMTTNQFYRDPIVFYQTCLALNDKPANWYSMGEHLWAEEVAWAVSEVALIDQPDGKAAVPEYDSEVAALVGVVLRQNGFTRPTSPLDFALMDPEPPVKDPELLQAIEARQSEQVEMLREFLALQLERLNVELSSLPLTVQPRSLDESSRNYIQELLTGEQALRQGAPQSPLARG